MDKKSFWDALYLRYGLNLPKLPTICVCGKPYTIEHALSCLRGGFVTIRHNEMRDLTAKLLTEVCNDVSVEPQLAPITGELFNNKTANKADEARLDVSARGFWVRGCKAFMDIRVFNPMAKTYSNQSIKAAHLNNEREKKRQYNERVLQVEHGSFTPTCV